MSNEIRTAALFQRGADGVWLGFCPAIRIAFAQGETLSECRRRLRDAIESVLPYVPSDDLEDLREGQAEETAAEVIEVQLPSPEERHELITQAVIARLAGVTRQAVSQWVKRRQDFPPPAARSRRGPLWDRDAVLRWLATAERSQGRPPVAASPWRHQGHLDVAFAASFHLGTGQDPSRFTQAVVEELEKLGSEFDAQPGEIRPLGPGGSTR